MSLQDLLNQASTYLKERNVEDPSLEAGLLLSWVLGKDLGTLYMDSGLSPNQEQIQLFWAAVERRGHHEPFAYITGECEFLSLSFKVNPHVLIPRADTEILAEAALKAMGKGSPYFYQPMFTLPEKDGYRVLDVGTGSGCLAISLAKNVSVCRVEALDISEQALATAKANGEFHHVSEQIRFIRGDFLGDLSALAPQYDLIVSNPPYIPAKDVEELMPSVRNYEPHTALAGGDDGLVFYRALAQKAPSLLAPHGIMIVECGYDQAYPVQALFLEKGMETLFLKDLSGINRVVASRRQV